MVRIQVSVVYLEAAVDKLRVPEWADGTALYYWFLHPLFGAPGWLRPLVEPVVTSAAGVTLLTWGVIALELVLFAGLFMDRRYRPLLLGFGLAFHFGIVVVHGLVSFFFAMAAALILYLRPVESPFGLPAVFHLRGRGGRAGQAPELQAAPAGRAPPVAVGEPVSVLSGLPDEAR